MKEKEISKARTVYEYIVEKIMEWAHFLRYGLIKNSNWVSNLCEEYHIHKNHINEEYLKDFLNERRKILNNNHYKMTVKELPENEDKLIIGKVILMRKNKYIHHATLKTKDCNCSKNRLIFWSFEDSTK